MQCRLISATGKEKTGRGLRWVAETIVGLIYPPRCPICDRVTAPECVPCRKCAETVQLAPEPVCKRCGKPLDGERAEFCLDCGKRRHAYCQGKAVFVYQGNIRGSPCTGLNMQTGANMRRIMRGRRQRFIRTGFLKTNRSDRSGAHVPVEKAAARIQSGRDIRAGAWQGTGASRGRRACAPCAEHGAAEGVKWRTKSGKFKKCFSISSRYSKI